MNKCKKCDLEFEPVKGLINYCSLKCRNSREVSYDTKLKTKNTLLVFFKSNPKKIKLEKDKKKFDICCSYCSLKFTSKYPKKKTCSEVCLKALQQQNASRQLKHGYGKFGYYKGIWCDSTYELIFLLNNPLAKRNELRIPYINSQGILSTYVPDFIYNDIIYEVKGRMDDNVMLKYNAAKELNIDIILLNDIKYFKEYEKIFKRKFNVKCLSELYDEYKPKYTYKCNFCNNIFTSDTKRITEVTFCCREHAGKYNSLKNNNYCSVV